MPKQMILIVDDEPINLSVLTNLFKRSFNVHACKSGEDALMAVNAGPKPDLILLDIMMPGIGGYETLSRLHSNSSTYDIPVIFISSLDSEIDEDKGFRLGAVDYITKPFKYHIIIARVNAHMELKQARDRLKNQNEWLESEVSRRTNENQLIQDAALTALTQLAETRDKGTGNHIQRTRQYVETLARRLQKNPDYIEILNEKIVSSIIKASPLHDIGKIGIPDAILLKPGKLTEEEFELIKTHCVIGGNALHRAIRQSINMNMDLEGELQASSLQFLEQAEIIAKYHHERWDGKGYPTGIKGDEIPLSARIMAVADVFDALTTARPYKKAWSFKEAMEYILDQSGAQFDPDVVDAFAQEKETFHDTMCLLPDMQ